MATSANSGPSLSAASRKRTQPVQPSATAKPKRSRRAPFIAPAERDFAGIATQYALDITQGRILACKWVKLACQRHLNDLKRSQSRDKAFPYVFDAELAARACKFIEKLPHVKGKWSRPRPGTSNRIHLEPHQVFKVASIFGWVHKRTRLRRFSEAFLSEARKGGKTVLAAAIGLYMLTADDEPGPEVYCAANGLEQAMEVFRPASQIANALPDLRRAYALEMHKQRIVRMDDGGRFRPLVGIARDGSSPHCTIIDEFHEALTSDQYDSNKNGMMAREQPLMLIVTTAGSNVEGPCHQLQREVERILSGLIINDNVFGIIYTLDEGDDAFSEANILKANPNYGISVLPEMFLRAMRDAQQQPAKRPEFLTKNCNQWINAGTVWIPPEIWDRCGDSALDINDFRGQPCFEGVDLAAKTDIASRCRIFRKDISGQAHYYAFWRHYIPQDRCIDGSHAHYAAWVHQQRMTTHPGAEIQLELIQRDIESELADFPRTCIAFDPWGAMQMQQTLRAQLGEQVVIDIPQTTQYLSPAMKEVEAAALAGRLHHDGDPVTAWAVSCVLVKEDYNDNVFPRKERNGRNKIDPVSAMLNAINRAMVGEVHHPYTEPMIGYL